VEENHNKFDEDYFDQQAVLDISKDLF